MGVIGYRVGLDLADWRILRDFLVLRVDSVKLGSAVFHSAQSNAFSCSKMLRNFLLRGEPRESNGPRNWHEGKKISG